MTHTPKSLAQLKGEAHSTQPVVRSCALQELLSCVRNDASSHPTVLPIFRATLRNEKDPWGIVSAAQGIEHMVGGDEARSAWQTVLNHSDGFIVVRAASAVADPSYMPVVLELLLSRPEVDVRNAAIRALGRMQYADAFHMLLEQLASEETRWDAVGALSDLGDPRAIPHLEPLLDDRSNLRGQDDRGCSIDVRDIAGYAIRRLQFLAKNAHMCGGPAVPPRLKPNFNPLAYLPLAASIVEVPWIAVVVSLPSGPSNGRSRAENTERNHQLDLLASIPVAAGLIIGIAMLVLGKAKRLPDQICIYLGCAICAGFLYALIREFFN